jgi:hypothetical protein
MIPKWSVSELRVSQTTINGVAYPDALVATMSCSSSTAQSIEINAGRNSKQFRGSLGLPDNQDSDDTYHVEVSYDGGAPVYTTELGFGETKPLSFDTPGVLRVKLTFLKTSKECGNTSNLVAIGNPVLVT